jgi:FkbM family methyltransferase
MSRLRRGRPQGMVQVRTAFGCVLEVDTREAIGLALERNEIFDIAVSEILARAAQLRATLLVDAGANVGYMSLLMAKFSAGTANVWAFEPHPEIYSALQRNVRLNDYDSKIHLVQCALSETQGAAKLFLPIGFEKNRGLASLQRPTPQYIEVRTDTLDRCFAQQRIDVLKVDVEGHELSVLKGADALFSKGQIGIVVYEAHEPHSGSIAEFLTKKGLSIWAIDYNLFGLQLSHGRGRLSGRFEAPSYLAVAKDSEMAFLRPRYGWRCLHTP